MMAAIEEVVGHSGKFYLMVSYCIITVKFLNFRTQENFAVKIKKKKNSRKEAKPLGISSKRCKWNIKQWRP